MTYLQIKILLNLKKMKMIVKSAVLLAVFSLLSCNADEKDAVQDSFDSFINQVEGGHFDRAAKYADGDLVDLLEEMAVEYDALSREQQLEFKDYLGEADYSIESVEFDGFSIFSSPKEATIVLEDGNLKEIDLIKKEDTWVIKDSNKKLISALEDALEVLQSYNTISSEYDYDDYGTYEEDVFYCWGNGSEIPSSWVNDGECDCDDCEDEDELFKCSSGEVIPISWYYDGDCDCNDCSDE